LFWCGGCALLVRFLLSVNVFGAFGLDFSSPEGNPLTKIHPATYIVLIAATFFFLQPLHDIANVVRHAPGLVAFLLLVPLLAIYALANAGYSGSAVYIETYVSAGLLALLLHGGTDPQKRKLGIFLLVVVFINAGIGVYESLTYTHLFPLVLGSEEVVPADQEFRAHAFYGHPLAASLITVMGIVLLYATRIRVWVMLPLFSCLMIALLAYGGRTALAVTLALTVCTTIVLTMRSLINRHMPLDLGLALLCGLIVVPALVGYVAIETSIGERIFATLYFDSSAQVRAEQWEVLNHLSLQQWLFGISMPDLLRLKYQIGLGNADTDIENFWLLIFLNIGSLGFVVYVSAFLAFLFYLGRQAGGAVGWVLVGSSLFILSSSNSLGVKSSELFFLTGFAIAMSGFRPSHSSDGRRGQ